MGDFVRQIGQPVITQIEVGETVKSGDGSRKRGPVVSGKHQLT